MEQSARRKARNEFERQREWFNAGRREVNLCPLCGPSAEQKVFNRLRSIVNDFDRFQKTGKNPPLDVSYFTAKQAKKKLERAIKRDRKERFERIRFSCVIYCI